MSWRQDIATHLKGKGYKVIDANERAIRPPCLMVRFGGTTTQVRDVKQRAVIEVIGQYTGGRDTDDVLGAFVQAVHTGLWEFRQCIPMDSTPVQDVEIEGKKFSVSRIPVEQI